MKKPLTPKQLLAQAAQDKSSYMKPEQFEVFRKEYLRYQKLKGDEIKR